MKFNIIGDSSINLSHKDVFEYSTVPLTIQCGDRTFVDDDQLDIEEMTEFLRNVKEKSSSSCPNVQDYLDAYEGKDNIFVITLSSNISGSFNAARLAANDCPDKKICLIDSLSAGPELFLIASKIKECEEKGCTFEQTEEIVKAYQKKTHILFALESMRNFANNGRVNPAVAKGAEFFGIRAIGRASDEGTLEVLHMAKGKKGTLDTIFKSMRSMNYDGGKVIITHTFNEEMANKLKELIQQYYPNVNITISTNSGLCSFYAERGGVLVAFEG